MKSKSKFLIVFKLYRIPQVQGDWHEYESKLRRKGVPGSEILPRLLSPQQSSTSSLPHQKQDDSHAQSNIHEKISEGLSSRKRPTTSEDSLKKKRKESYNRALMEGQEPFSASHHLSSQINHTHNLDALPAYTSNQEELLICKDSSLGFDYFYVSR